MTVPLVMEPGGATLDVFWRPGCGYCTSLRMVLAEAGVTAQWHDIWSDPEAAAYVRSVAGGNETVPTVRLGDRALVAPRPRALVAELARTHPELVGDARRWRPLRIAQWITIAVLLVVAILLAVNGEPARSWLVVALASVSYVGFRSLRSRAP